MLINKRNGDLATSSAYREDIEIATRKLHCGCSKQHDSRRGQFSLNTVSKVVETFRTAQRMDHYSKPPVVLVSLYVRNAFNSVR